METERRKARGPGYEQYEDDINWTAGVGKPAGVYWLHGRIVIAGHDTAAEERLLLQGAALIATLLFERDPREGFIRGHTVERRSAARVREEMLLSGVN
jgi:hypothetical protein